MKILILAIGQLKNKKNYFSGFSLLELIVVISIISVVGIFVGISSNFLNIKGNVIDLKETELYQNSRKIKKVKLLHSYLGDINIAISFPKNSSKKPLPVLFILGGIETGIKSIKHVSDIGNNILVGFDWPISDDDLESKEIIPNLSRLYKKIFYSPKQAAAAIEWVSKQNWAEDRISLLGFSIGSIVTFISIGLIILILKIFGEEIGWGFQLQSPIFVSLLIYLFALD